MLHRALWTLALCSLFAGCSWLAWCALSVIDFGYPLWHSWLDITSFIQTYGPKNLYKQGFELTTAEEHYRLFSAINTAIHQSGAGLESLTYHYTQNGQVFHDTLLRPPEIVHLKDVANLVTVFQWAGMLLGAFSLLLIGGLKYQQSLFPKPLQILLGFVGLLVIVGLILAIFGPTHVFYQLHIWLFPPNHPWFFYYEESLMTTLMLAPTLFGYIASALIILTSVLWLLGLYGLNRWFK